AQGSGGALDKNGTKLSDEMSKICDPQFIKLISCLIRLIVLFITLITDTDNNGYLDLKDFENLALRFTLLELKGKYNPDSHQRNKEIMRNLWNEIALLADFNKDGQVTVTELKDAIKDACMAKKFDELPESLKCSIQSKFRSIDVDGDNLISLEEYRIEIINRSGCATIDEIDYCWDKLLNDDDRKKGGISLQRYQELWAQFIGSTKDDVNGVYLFGPLPLSK
ncbi:sarcoplasmic calcium-binding protein 1-like protein, partial [Dinothrombium tinctorium]